MPFVTPEITCNLQWRNTTRQLAFAKQGEFNSRKIAVSLYNGANRFTFENGTYTGEFAYKRPDGAGAAYSTIGGDAAVVLNGDTGVAVITLAPEVLAVAGIVECELRLKTSGSLLATFTFGYYVEKAVVDSSTPSPSPDPGPTPTPTGEKTKFFGFASQSAYETFVSENPGVLGDGDIVVITSTSDGNTLHTFYVLVSGTLTSRHVITVPPAGSSGASTLSALGGGFGTCASALNTAAKIVQIDGFKRVQGVPFAVKFTNGAKNGDTLNVRSSSSSSSGTGAAALYYNGSAIPNGLISAGAVATLYYDDSNYSVLSVSAMDDGLGVCSGDGTNRAVTITGLAMTTGTRISVRFDTYDMPASATLNVNSYGAKAIRRNGAAIAAGVISAGDVATFVYDGTYWQLVGLMPANPASGGDSTTEIIKMSMSGSTPVASKTASQIAALVGDNPSNVVLIDLLGRECALCVKPTAGVFYSPAKFFTLDEDNEVLIVYSVADTTGEVTSESISLGGSSGGGAEVFNVVITTGTGASSTKTAAEIYAAKQAGKIIQCSIDGNTATLLENCAATESRFFEISVDSGRMLRAVTVGTSNNATTISEDVWTIGNANEPEAVTLTGSTPSISPVVDNCIYTGGELTSLNVGTWTDGRRFTLIFTSGSSPTSLVWANNHEPVWPANFDGTPEANTRYEINVVGGYAVVGAWEVSS